MSEGKKQFWIHVIDYDARSGDLDAWVKDTEPTKDNKSHADFIHVIEKSSFDKAIEAIREAQKNWCIVPICDCPLCRVLKELGE